MFIESIINRQKRSESDMPVLKCTDEVGSLNINQIIDCPSNLINVADETGKIIGAVRKDTLIYLFYTDNSALLSVLQSMDEAVIAIDMDSRIFFANHMYTEILGVPLHKLIGHYLKTIEPHAALLDVLKDGQPRTIKKQPIQSMNKYVSTKMAPLYDGNIQIGAFSIFTDITELNQLNNQIDHISSVAENYSKELMKMRTLRHGNTIGESKKYIDCIDKALCAAQTDVSVLLRGENGSGKEVIALSIVENSKRKDKPFITVNCSAIPENLIESELFGYENGAFTGGKKGGSLGKFQLADGGTIFLDEIGDLPLAVQPKLLRVLQNGEIEKIGRQKNIPVDVRIIAATNRPLEDMIKEGTFRSDLYYRLNVFPVKIPPLRERGQDIMLLANHFLSMYCSKYEKSVYFSPEVIRILSHYRWPGNVRELQNVVESAVVLCRSGEIYPEHLPEWLMSESSQSLPNDTVPEDAGPSALLCTKEFGTLADEVAEFEKEVIRSTLERFGGSRAEAMEALGLTRRTFYRKLSLYNLTGRDR